MPVKPIKKDANGFTLETRGGTVLLRDIPASAGNEITVPPTVTKILKSLLTGCNKVTSITLSDNVKEISAGTLAAFPKLEKVLVSKNNPYFESDGTALFSKGRETLLGVPTNLSGMYFVPNGVKYIDTEAFRDCKNLKSIVLPQTLLSIEEKAFKKCTRLSHLLIPKSVTKIAVSAFEECSKLCSITVAEDSRSYESDSCGVLFTKNKKKLVYVPPMSLDDAYDIPEGVVGIGTAAFSDCKSLKSISMPKSLKSIGMSAFANCNSLKIVRLGDNVESIPFRCFSNCIDLEHIYICDKVLTIKNLAFEGCSSMRRYSVSASNTAFSSDNYGALLNREQTELLKAPSKLQDLYPVPDTVTSIAYGAFNLCKEMKRISLPFRLKDIDSQIFADCTSLKDIYFRDARGIVYNKETLEIAAVSKEIEYAEITEGVTEIPKKAFASRENLTTVVIPESVSQIGDFAFTRSPKLNEIKVSPQSPSFYTDQFGVLYKKINKNVEIVYVPKNLGGSYTAPKEVTHIGIAAFEGCTKLTEVILPQGFRACREFAFVDCATLTRIELSGTHFYCSGKLAQNCPNLTLYCKASSDAADFASKNGIPFVAT